MDTKSPTALSLKVRTRLGSVLSDVLADEFALSAVARDYHWNVSGPNFRSLQELFSDQYHQIDRWMEKLADRARLAGVTARTGLSELLQSPNFTAERGADASARRMIGGLIDLHTRMARKLRGELASEAALQTGHDGGTAALLEELVEFHDTSAWMLGELLEDRDAIQPEPAKILATTIPATSTPSVHPGLVPA